MGWLRGKRIYQNELLYLTRYYLKGDGNANSWELYLHHIHRPDVERAPHNHPWPWFLSIVLKGWYREVSVSLQDSAAKHPAFWDYKWVRWFNFMPRRSLFHRITTVPPKGAWTLVLVPPRAGVWGFAVNGKFIEYDERRHAVGTRVETF